MLRIYYIEPVQSINPYIRYRNPDQRIYKRNKPKCYSIGLSFSQHLDLIHNTLNK
ncbi:hypothetical protein PIL02S_03481 [Paenibacillus illinoisensis]|uniref:Uncharacterized protein n=1 Tax=Paenibacillus illinoisensis TaxID=59845 RepID=A0A2W0C745_9BACL|nr:hypothetical protein PIL02S_03481 [Paenibacillus illinoisensis]